MDAFVHCFEAFCAPGFHPLADGVALEACGSFIGISARLRDGKDIEARAHMLAAASMGAAAFQKGLGGVHAIAHPVGSWSTPIMGSPMRSSFLRHHVHRTASADKTDIMRACSICLDGL